MKKYAIEVIKLMKEKQIQINFIREKEKRREEKKKSNQSKQYPIKKYKIQEI